VVKKGKEKRPDSGAGSEALLLWAVLAEGGGKDVARATLDNKGMLPNEDKKARDGLKDRGLITAEQRYTQNDNGRSVRGIWITVTEAGWVWAEENLVAPLARSQAAAPILQAWMRRISIFLNNDNASLSKFFGSHHASGAEVSGPHPQADGLSSPPHQQPLAPNYDTLRARIREAYLELTGGRLNTRALLSDLREKLSDIDRPALDEALKQMQQDEEASLYQLDNQVELTDADRAAAIYFGGEPRHILWIER
jgi:hypothetical protein